MLIERYSRKYNEDIKTIVKNFHIDALKEYGMSLDMSTLQNTIEELKSQAFLLVTNDSCQGLLAGKAIEIPYNQDKIWHEVIWYVNKEYRKYGMWLLREATKVLKKEGFSKMVMVNMENSAKDRIAKVYEHLGFRPMETHWIRSI